jgi:SAM-dependent methyltransferase
MQDELHLDTLGISEDEKTIARRMPLDGIDPAVSVLIGATNGNAYKHLIGRQFAYPIPPIELPEGNGRSLLDIGCGWGRWSIAASRKGYRATGIDPSKGAIMAAGRVAKQFGAHSAQFICGDARDLPFPDGSFDVAFSYSVIQHFSREDARKIFKEIGRVLKPGGVCKVQMPNRLALRSLYVQARRGVTDGKGFDVRYWSIPVLCEMLCDTVGPAEITAHCYLGLGLEPSDIDLMPKTTAYLIRLSSLLCWASRRTPLCFIAWQIACTSPQRTSPDIDWSNRSSAAHPIFPHDLAPLTVSLPVFFA